MRSKRSNAPPETARARGFACRVGESGATPEPHRPRPDAERYVHTVRDLTFPIGDVAVGIGSPLVSRREPKRSFLTPRGAFARGDAMFTGGRIRDPTAERHPHALPAHHARSARPPLGIRSARSHRRGQNPSGTSSGALGRRDFVRPEFIAMLNDAGGPCWRYESRAGL